MEREKECVIRGGVKMERTKRGLELLQMALRFQADEKENFEKRREKDHTREGSRRRNKWEVKGRKRKTEENKRQEERMSRR